MQRFFIILVMLCAMVNVERALAVEPELPAMTGKNWRNMVWKDKMYYSTGFLEAYFVALLMPNYFVQEVDHLDVELLIEYLDAFYADVANQNVPFSLGLLTFSQAMTGMPEATRQTFIKNIQRKNSVSILRELQRIMTQVMREKQATAEPPLPPH